MDVTLKVYLTVEMKGLPENTDPDTLNDLVYNTIHQPFDDGIVTMNLPEGGYATVTVDEMKF